MTIVIKTNILLLGKCIQQIDDERDRGTKKEFAAQSFVLYTVYYML
jgi:hypothetical protein